MKVSVNWVKQFTDIDIPLDDLVEKIGAQLGAIEEVIDVGKAYAGALVVRVVACDKHPSADKLNVCLVDDGGIIKKLPRDINGFVQVVCGAPNVEAGKLYVWLPPGTTVPSTVGGEAFVLEAREIRGVLSQGMLASPKELAFGDDHSGLLAIDENIEPGTPFAKAFRLDDAVIDIENKMFTHRPDLFGILGIAREIAGISGQPFKSPDWYLKPARLSSPSAAAELEISVKNKAGDKVPRFCAIAIAGVKVGPSPIWLQSYLMRAGIRPINNVVDVTNFVMFETGQPLHPYDYDKLAAGKPHAELVARFAKSGEELTLLDGKTVKLDNETLIIASADKPVGIAGVMGGLESSVDEETKNIVLECANFDMNLVRKLSRAYGLFTEASTRFTKNPSVLQNPSVITKASEDILRIASGVIASPLIDVVDTKPAKTAAIKVSAEFVNSRLGLSLSAKVMADMLRNVEIATETSGQTLEIRPPFWRTDLAIAEDIVEEIGRLHGYEHLQLALPTRSLAPASVNADMEFKDKLRNLLAKNGASELLTYSFINESLIEKAGQDQTKAFELRNSLSPQLQKYRLSLAPSLLEKVHPNIKLGFERIALFELGTVHQKGLTDTEKLPAELQRLCVITADKSGSQTGAAYYLARRYADLILDHAGIKKVQYQPFSPRLELGHALKTAAEAYEPGRTALVSSGKKAIGLVGEPTAALKNSLKLPAATAMFEFDVSILKELAGPPGGSYQPLNRFPATSFDLCLRAGDDVTYAKLNDLIDTELEKAKLRRGYGYELTGLNSYQSPKNKTHRQTTWRISLHHPQKTLTTREANQLADQIALTAKAKLRAVRV